MGFLSRRREQQDMKRAAAFGGGDVVSLAQEMMRLTGIGVMDCEQGRIGWMGEGQWQHGGWVMVSEDRMVLGDAMTHEIWDFATDDITGMDSQLDTTLVFVGEGEALETFLFSTSDDQTELRAALRSVARERPPIRGAEG